MPMLFGCMLPALLAGLLPQAPPAKSTDVLVRAARIILEPGTVLTDQALLIRDGAIAQVGTEIPPEAAAAAQLVEFSGRTIVAGFVDPHSHLGLGADLAERVTAFTPALHAADAFDPFDVELLRQARGGVTTAVLAPLSANTFGGIAAVVHTGAVGTVDKTEAYLKIALVAESLDQERAPTSHIGAAELIRTSFRSARVDVGDASANAKTLRDALSGNLPTVFHARTHAEISAALDLCEDLNLQPILLGADAAARSLSRLAAVRASIILAPLTLDARQPVLELPASLERAGIPFSFTTVPTIAPATPRPQTEGRGGRGRRGAATAEQTPPPVPDIGHPDSLRLSAALAIRHGLSRDGALAALTRTPATQCGIGATTGTLRRGAHADFLVFSGDPLDLRSRLEAVYVRGRVLAMENQR